MFVFYGSRHYGSLWKVGDQRLVTKFFHVYWLPLIPTGSEFILEQGGDSYRRIPVSLSGRSILLGYMRVHGFVATVITFFMALAAWDAGNYWFAGVPVLAAVLWGLTMFKWGNLSVGEQAQCSLLQLVTGIGLFPKRMPNDMVQEIWQSMAEDLVKHGIEVDPTAWMRRTPKRDEPGLPLLYAFAMYADALEPDGQWHDVAEKFWSVLENMTIEELGVSMETFRDAADELQEQVLAESTAGGVEG